MRTRRQPRRRQGFLMLEVVLALGIFGMAATAFAVALARTSDAAQLAQRRLQVNRILDSALTATLSLPNMEEGIQTVVLEEEVGGEQVSIDTNIEPIEDLENEDGELLQQMFRITVSAHWLENGEMQEEIAETWRYGRMYQP